MAKIFAVIKNFPDSEFVVKTKTYLVLIFISRHTANDNIASFQLRSTAEGAEN